MRNSKGYTLAVFLVWLVIVVTLGIGWVKNIIAIVGSDFSHITGLLVVRIIGIFLAPLGSFLGYFF